MPKKPHVRRVVGSQYVKGSNFVIFFDNSETEPAGKSLS